MRLLLVTQAVDEQDLLLGFFTRWIETLAPHFDLIEVICLKEGKHAFPANVRVHSLGKEGGRRSRAVYAARFLSLAWQLRGGYDAVFVHMNQEYILIAGWLWKLLGKRIYMWRNHYAGSFATDLAAAFCTKVFCTSMHSYTAKYRKTVLMPVGVDLARFGARADVARAPRSILFFARIAPSKRPDLFIEALGMLMRKDISFVASLYGSPLPQDEAYYESLKSRADALGLHGRLIFHAGVNNEQAPQVFAAHEIFVNCSPSGMFDKMLFEAAASGCTVLAVSDDFMCIAGEDTHFTSSAELAERLIAALDRPRGHSVPPFVEANSLAALGKKLAEALYSF